MVIKLKNFGKFADLTYVFRGTNTHPNGFGKTTLINAYVWVLSGKTINGFEPRRVDAPADEPTSVTLYVHCNVDNDTVAVRRTTTAKGTIVYVDDEVKTQSELDQMLNVPLRVACANTSILTDSSLTSEQLRKFLSVTDVMNLDESDKLRKRQTSIRKELKTAEQYALTNVEIPVRTVDELSDVDKDFIKRFEKANRDMITHAVTVDTCPQCGQKYPENVISEHRRKSADAKAFVDAWRDEYARVVEQLADYNRETQAIEDAKRLIETAKNARLKVADLTAELQTIEAELRSLDAKAINAELPDGVTVQTEKTTKTTGTTSSTCTLLFNGIPLKSVNHAERVKICVQILYDAIKRSGLNEIPIIVDAAGEVLEWGYAPNLILFYAG